METLKEAPRIARGKTELWTPHDRGEVAFVIPPIWKLTSYENARRKILKDGLSIPTGDEMASLLYSVYCSNTLDEPEFSNIRDVNGLWIFNRNLWTENGVYVFQDSNKETGELNIRGLEDMLSDGEEISGVRFSNDGKLRFAPKGTYNIRKCLSQKSISNDGFMIASFGIEGAEKLGKISEKNGIKLYSEGINVQKGLAPKPYNKVSAFVKDKNETIRVDGFRSSEIGLNYALGTLPKVE